MMLNKKRYKFGAQHHRDIVIAACIVVVVYLLSALFDLAEFFIEWAASLDHDDHYNIDELPMVFLSMAIIAIWFSRRRIRELNAEIAMRAKAEAKSMESLDMFRSLFQEGLSGNFIADAKGNVVLCNEAFRIMSGMTLNAQQKFNLATALGRQEWETLLEKLKESEYLDFSELALKRPDKGAWVVMARFRTSLLNKDQGCEIHGYFTDITEQYLAERELATLLVENRALTRHAMQVQEEERCHLAREIHDDLGQYLTAIRLDAATIPRDTENGAAGIHAERIARHAEHIQAAIKRIIKRLRPAALDAHGLTEAVRCLARDWRKQNPDIRCDLELDESCSNLPEFIGIITYRIVQEALTNIARHARASRVNILIQRIQPDGTPCLLVQIQDNGIGFEPASQHSSFGLTGMRERIESAQGTFKLASRKGAGVLISARIPLNTVKRSEYVENIAG
ncbi:two-component system, NarL family, sensor histidine kinase UhpB [Methylophilaceae bacterium]|nr:two-component system, NarL family, sensor histidine kinase UhpB [Methylophilaceae bacterium]